MTYLLDHSAELLILIFLIITFAMSFIDKVSDWNGNIAFLKSHFSQTFVVPLIPVTLSVIVALEALCTLCCGIGIFELLTQKTTTFALLGSIISSLILLLFLLGQRIAKDFDGARNITVYFIVSVIAVYLFQQ